MTSDGRGTTRPESFCCAHGQVVWPDSCVIHECAYLWSHGYPEPCQREVGHEGVCRYNGRHAHPRTDQPCNPRCVTR